MHTPPQLTLQLLHMLYTDLSEGTEIDIATVTSIAYILHIIRGEGQTYTGHMLHGKVPGQKLLSSLPIICRLLNKQTTIVLRQVHTGARQTSLQQDTYPDTFTRKPLR
jgi:hypothetical protein